MSRAPIMIADLKIGNKVWKLAARVVDLWIVKDRTGQQHFECVLQDSKCDKIHVVTRNRDFDLWKQRLREHQTVMVYNGDPLNNDLALKVCDNPLKLVFNGGTTVTVVDMPEMPAYQFCFKPIVDFSRGDFRVNRLYDVISVLHEVVKTQVAGDGKKACVNLVVSDGIGSEIDMTLWEAYATQFMAYTNEKTTHGPTIIVITHAMCQQSSATGKLYISNAWHGTKLLLDYDHPQVTSFKSKLGGNVTSQVMSQPLSQPCASQGSFVDRSFSYTNYVKAIGEIISLQNQTFCNTIGTTKGFKSSKFGWYYEQCPACNRTNKSPGEPFICTCCENAPTPITKYKIEIEVEYDGNCGYFVFWDNDCIKYVGMSAHDLREIMKKSNEDHPQIYPEHLDKLIGKEFAFRVKFQPNYKQASVVKITEDKEVIKMIKEAIHPIEETSTAAMKAPIAKAKEVVLNEHIPDNEVLSPTSLHTPTMSASQNWSDEAYSSNTPSKRLSQEHSIEDLGTTAFLSPKQSATKSGKHAKIE